MKIALVVYGDGLPPCDETLAGFESIVPPRLGDDTTLHGGEPEVAERLERAQRALRLVIEGDDLSLLGARAADALEALAVRAIASELARGAAAPSIDVLDVLSLDARPLAQAVVRLRAPVRESCVWIGTRPIAAGRFDVETFGLRKLGLRELCIPSVRASELDAVTRFVELLAEYVDTTGARPDAGARVSFGWVDVTLVAAEARAGYPSEPAACAPRIVREAMRDAALPGVMIPFEPASDDEGAPLRPGVERAAGIVAGMLATARDFGLELNLEVPRARDSAIACRRVGTGGGLAARRLEARGHGDSGWVVVCGDGTHDHDDRASFHEPDLRALVAAAPRLLPLLALPAGTGITLGADETLTVMPPPLPESGKNQL